MCNQFEIAPFGWSDQIIWVCVCVFSRSHYHTIGLGTHLESLIKSNYSINQWIWHTIPCTCFMVSKVNFIVVTLLHCYDLYRYNCGYYMCILLCVLFSLLSLFSRLFYTFDFLSVYLHFNCYIVLFVFIFTCCSFTCSYQLYFVDLIVVEPRVFFLFICWLWEVDLGIWASNIREHIKYISIKIIWNKIYAHKSRISTI